MLTDGFQFLFVMKQTRYLNLRKHLVQLERQGRKRINLDLVIDLWQMLILDASLVGEASSFVHLNMFIIIYFVFI